MGALGSLAAWITEECWQRQGQTTKPGAVLEDVDMNERLAWCLRGCLFFCVIV